MSWLHEAAIIMRIHCAAALELPLGLRQATLALGRFLCPRQAAAHLVCRGYRLLSGLQGDWGSPWALQPSFDPHRQLHTSQHCSLRPLQPLRRRPNPSGTLWMPPLESHVLPDIIECMGLE